MMIILIMMILPMMMLMLIFILKLTCIYDPYFDLCIWLRKHLSMTKSIYGLSYGYIDYRDAWLYYVGPCWIQF